MKSLRNRLAAAPSPSSPVRSRYSQAIWKESSSSCESETVIRGKRIRAACVPRHLPFAARFRPSTVTGSERKITSPKTWVSVVSRLSQAANFGSRQSRPNASRSEAICRFCGIEQTSSNSAASFRHGPLVVLSQKVAAVATENQIIEEIRILARGGPDESQACRGQRSPVCGVC
jgi:hypothetical protein